MIRFGKIRIDRRGLNRRNLSPVGLNDMRLTDVKSIQSVVLRIDDEDFNGHICLVLLCDGRKVDGHGEGVTVANVGVAVAVGLVGNFGHCYVDVLHGVTDLESKLSLIGQNVFV